MLTGILSCSKSNDKNKLRVPLAANPTTLDWNKASDANSFDVIVNLMEGLLQYDEEMNVIPAIAKGYEHNRNHTKYRFFLRQDVRWSDGEPVLCKHFKDSWIRLLTPETAAEYAYFIYHIKNSEEFNTGKIKNPEKVGIKCFDNYTLDVELKESVPFFEHIVTFMVTFPIRKDLLEDYGNKFFSPKRLVVTGPYLLSKEIQDYKISLKRNPLYHGEAAKTPLLDFYIVENESIALNLFNGGMLDLIRNLPPNSFSLYKSDHRLRTSKKLAVIYLAFGKKLPKSFEELRLRQYLNQAIDRKWLTKALSTGETPLMQFLPISKDLTEFRKDRQLNRDIIAWNKKIAQSKPDNLGKDPLKLRYRTSGNFPLIAQNIFAQLTQAGFKIELEPMDDKMFFQQLSADSRDLFIGRWIADYPDPNNFMELFLSNAGNNHTFFKNEEYDKLITVAKSQDIFDRKVTYGRAQRLLLLNECAIIPLFQIGQNILLQEQIQNFKPNALDILTFKGVVNAAK